MRGSARRSSVKVLLAGAGALALLVVPRGDLAQGAGSGALVAVLHPINEATGAVNTSVNLGTAKFTQGKDQVDVLVQLNGISVAGQEAERAADGQGTYFPHGIHIHEGSSCGPTKDKDGKVVPGGEAGAHLDPAQTSSHAGPEGNGHAGDLPNIRIIADGSGILMTSTKLLTLDQIKGRTIVLHRNRDNYTNNPPNGGSGARIACGVIKAE